MKKVRITLWSGITSIVVAAILDAIFSKSYTFGVAATQWQPEMWGKLACVAALLILGIVLIIYSRILKKKEKNQAEE